MDRRQCEDIAELISAYADSEVTPEESLLVKAHLEECPSCAARLAYYQRLQNGLQQYLASVPVPPLQQTKAATISGKGSRAMDNNKTNRIAHPLVPRFAAMALAAVAVFVIAFAAMSQLGNPMQPVQAYQILEKTAEVASNPSALGVKTVELTRTFWTKQTNPRFGTVGEEIASELHLWWQEPNLWRLEAQQTGQVVDTTTAQTINVSNGQSVWSVSESGKSVTINEWEPQLDVLQGFSAMWSVEVISSPDDSDADLTSLLKNARECYEPQLLREESVAGRPAYVIDLGSSKCPSASAPDMNGRRVIWVDKETFFELKSEQYAVNSDQEVIATSEVTSIEYNHDIGPELFAFTPSADAVIRDFRPKPAPSIAEYQQQLRQMAEQVDFSVFVPQYLPQGLQPRQPRLDPELGLELAYVPAEEVETDSYAGQNGINITQLRATHDLVSRWIEAAERVSIDDAEGWLRRGVRNADGTGSDSAALVLSDGTLISINSFSISPEELVQIAASLKPAPGSKPPLTDFTMPDIVEKPAVTPTPVPAPEFTILRPTWLPEPMTVREQYIAGSPEFGSGVVLGFDPRPDDAPHDVLTLTERPKAQIEDPGLPDPQETVETIGGLDVRVIKRGDACIAFIWEQDGVELTLTNAYDPPGHPRYSCDEMRRIAESIE